MKGSPTTKVQPVQATKMTEHPNDVGLVYRAVEARKSVQEVRRLLDLGAQGSDERRAAAASAILRVGVGAVVQEHAQALEQQRLAPVVEVGSLGGKRGDAEVDGRRGRPGQRRFKGRGAVLGNLVEARFGVGVDAARGEDGVEGAREDVANDQRDGLDALPAKHRRRVGPALEEQRDEVAAAVLVRQLDRRVVVDSGVGDPPIVARSWGATP